MRNLKSFMQGAVNGVLLSSLLFFGAQVRAQSNSQSTNQNSTSQSGTNSAATQSSSEPGSKPSSDAKANAAGGSQTAAGDRKFIEKATKGGEAEVELGKLATEKASSPEVKQFGQRMVDDHTQANQELEQIASQKGITPDKQLDPKDQKLKDRLSNLSGAEFDKAYMKAMVRDHKKDVAEFQRVAQNGKDSDVRNFAAKTLPTLKEHLRMAEQQAGSATLTSQNTNSQKY